MSSSLAQDKYSDPHASIDQQFGERYCMCHVRLVRMSTLVGRSVVFLARRVWSRHVIHSTIASAGDLVSIQRERTRKVAAAVGRSAVSRSVYRVSSTDGTDRVTLNIHELRSSGVL